MSQLPIRLFRVIVYSNIFVALAASCATISGSLLFGNELSQSILPSTIVGIATFLVYNFQRLWRIQDEFSDDRKEELNDRVLWIYENRSKLKVGMFIALAILTVQLWKLNVIELIFLALSGLLSIVYVMPVVPFRGSWRMLRDVPFLKIFLVGVTWVLATIYFPVLFGKGVDEINKLSIHILALERFLFIFAITLPFDVRDVHYDKKNGLQTFVLKFGVKKVVMASVIFLLTLSLMNIVHYIMGNQTSILLPLNALNYLIAMFIVSKSNTDRGELFYSGLIESTLIVQFILIFISKWM